MSPASVSGEPCINVNTQRACRTDLSSVELRLLLIQLLLIQLALLVWRISLSASCSPPHPVRRPVTTNPEPNRATDILSSGQLPALPRFSHPPSTPARFQIHIFSKHRTKSLIANNSIHFDLPGDDSERSWSCQGAAEPR